jgi:hypothetical protein
LSKAFLVGLPLLAPHSRAANPCTRTEWRLNELFPKPVPLQLIAPGQAEIIYRKNTGPVEAARIDETACCQLQAKAWSA